MSNVDDGSKECRVADVDFREYFTNDKIKVLQDAFDSVDRDKKGSLNEADLYALMQKLGKSLSRSQVKEIMREMDFNGNGLLEFDEFCVLEIKMNRSRPRADLIKYRDYLDDKMIQLLEFHFAKQDTTGCGFLTHSQIENILEQTGKSATAEEVEEVLAELDKEQTGEFDFDKFAAFWAVIIKRRKPLNYREFLEKEDVAKFRKYFKDADTRGRGCLTSNELDSALRNMGGGWSLRRVQQKCHALWQEFDEDGSGTIDFQEFLSMMLRIKGTRRLRVENCTTHTCEELLKEKEYTVGELQMVGFSIEDFKKLEIPVGQIIKEGQCTALELRHAGYSAEELRRSGMGASALRAAGYSLAELRNAGYSAAALLKANRLLRNSLSSGDLSLLARQRPFVVSSEAFERGFAFRPTKLTAAPRPLTPCIRDHVDWRPVFKRRPPPTTEEVAVAP